jgi:hypothetical protein
MCNIYIYIYIYHPSHFESIGHCQPSIVYTSVHNLRKKKIKVSESSGISREFRV